MAKLLYVFLVALMLTLASRAEDRQWVSLGKLLVGGAEVNPKLENGESIPEDFYGTSVEIIQSRGVLERAHNAVRAAHPELQAQPCKVVASRLPQTRIIVVRASGADPAFTQTYLDAIMEAFLAARKDLKKGGGEGTVAAINVQLVRLEKDIKRKIQEIKAEEPRGPKPEQLIETKGDLEILRKQHDRLLVTLRTLDVKKGVGENAAVAINDELAKLEKDIARKNERIKAEEPHGAKPEQLVKTNGDLEILRKQYDRLLATLRTLDVGRTNGPDVISILERATPSQLDTPATSLPNPSK